MRALAVLLVMAYHGGVPGLRVAGFYGVDVFFVLSGFLITRLLLDERAAEGRIRFAAFWARRARRLLPALLVMLVLVEAYVAFFAPSGRYPGFRGDALSVIVYMSNWHFIQASSDYFNATGAPSLLTHTWSLAIEEQFYLVWPLVVWAVARVATRTRRNPAAVVLAASAAGALASAGWMAHLYRVGASASRLYYGTDTHALSILTGCALGAALMLSPPERIRRVATPVAVLAIAGLGWAAVSLGTSDTVSFQGGFLLVALLSAALIAAVVADPASVAARTFSLRPVAYVGRISYGMYLWYFPLFAWIDRSATGLTGPGLFVLRCAADVAAATVSFHLIELPVRRRAFDVPFRLPAGAGALAAGAAAALVSAALVVAGTPGLPRGATTASYPAAASSPAPAASSPGPVASSPAPAGSAASTVPGATRLLVFGDSTGATLGDDLALSPAALQHRLAVDVVGMFGCGLVISSDVNGHGEVAIPPPPCRAGTPQAKQWPALLRSAVASFRPDEVLIATGRWEVESRRASSDGPWVDITEPRDAAYVRQQLETAASIVSGGGARLAVATAPCFSSGEQPDGNAWPEDSRARLDAYNALVRQVVSGAAASRPGSARVVDLDAILCPGGTYRTSVDGVTVRAPDGIHYPYFDIHAPDQADPDTLSQSAAFGAWIEPRIVGSPPGLSR